jgi:hypothetical protein
MQKLIVIFLTSLLSIGTASAQWQYREIEDKMRGEVTRGAVSLSTNFVSLPFPYEGETKLGIFVFSRASRTGLSISSTKGILSCSSSGCRFSAKFDDEPVIGFRATGGSNGNHDTLYLERLDEEKFLQKMRSAKTVQIEVSFFRSGLKQFSFDIADLKL